MKTLITILLAHAAGSAFAAKENYKPDDLAESASPFTRLTDPSGCLIEQITTGDADHYQVQGVSTDGRTLLMATRQKGAENLDSRGFEMDLSTGEKTDLSSVFTNSGTYSPDGKHIVVAQESDNGKTDIYEYERATGKLQPVASHEDWDWLPSYSPDGRFILFNSYRVDGQSDIHLFEKSTKTLRRLTEFPGYDAHGQYSPDGERIIFNRQQGTRDDGGYIFDVIMLDINTGQETQLTQGEYEEGYPAWAPDAQHIVYSSDADGQSGKLNLYILGLDSDGVSRMTQGDWKDSYAFWTRDGEFIYFNSDRSGATNIYRLLMNGSDCARVGK